MYIQQTLTTVPRFIAPQKARHVDINNRIQIATYLNAKGTSPEKWVEKAAKLIRISSQRNITIMITPNPQTRLKGIYLQSELRLGNTAIHPRAKFGNDNISYEVLNQLGTITTPLFQYHPNPKMMQPLLSEFYKLGTSTQRTHFFNGLKAANESLYQAFVEALITNYGLVQNNGLDPTTIAEGRQLGNDYAINPIETAPKIQSFIKKNSTIQFRFLQTVSGKLQDKLESSATTYDDTRKYAKALEKWFGHTFAIALIESKLPTRTQGHAILEDPKKVVATLHALANDHDPHIVNEAHYNAAIHQMISQVVRPLLDGATHLTIQVNLFRQAIPTLKALGDIWEQESPLIGEAIDQILNHPELNQRSTIQIQVGRSFHQDQILRSARQPSPDTVIFQSRPTGPICTDLVVYTSQVTIARDAELQQFYNQLMAILLILNWASRQLDKLIAAITRDTRFLRGMRSRLQNQASFEMYDPKKPFYIAPIQHLAFNDRTPYLQKQSPSVLHYPPLEKRQLTLFPGAKQAVHQQTIPLQILGRPVEKTQVGSTPLTYAEWTYPLLEVGGARFDHKGDVPWRPFVINDQESEESDMPPSTATVVIPEQLDATQEYTNIAHLPEVFEIEVDTYRFTISRVPTLSDGSCGFHAALSPDGNLGDPECERV